MISLYRAGTSPLHRLPAGAKLAVLAVLALAISLGARTAPLAAASLAAVFLAFVLGGFGPATWLRQMWGARWIVVLVALTQVLFLPPEDAFANTTRVVSVVLLAGLLTLTTRTSDLLEALQRALSPLRRIGVDPWRVGFTLTLTIALVPVVAGFAQRIREAQRARDVRLGPRAVVTLLVMSLRHGDDVADALAARGIA